jgi:hypothetical protein
MKAALTIISMCVLTLNAMVASAEPISFTNYAGDFRMDPTGAVWGSFYHEGPWKWFPKENAPAPFWSPQTSILWEGQYQPPEPQQDGTMVLPYNATITIQATDNGRIDGTPIGTMVFDNPGRLVMSMTPESISVDSQDVLFFLPFWTEDPATMSLVEETGIFATDGITVPGDLLQEMKGVAGLATVDGMTPAEVLLTHGFSPELVVGGMSESVVYGAFVPEPASIALLGLGGCLILVSGLRRPRLIAP